MILSNVNEATWTNIGKRVPRIHMEFWYKHKTHSKNLRLQLYPYIFTGVDPRWLALFIKITHYVWKIPSASTQIKNLTPDIKRLAFFLWNVQYI